MKFIRNFLIVVLILAAAAAFLPSAALFTIHGIERNYSLRVNSFSSVDSVIDDYHTLADVISEKIGEEKISAGDTLFFGDEGLFLWNKKSNAKEKMTVSREEKKAMQRLHTFSHEHSMVRVFDDFYYILAEQSDDALIYSVKGKRPPKKSPLNDYVVYYSPQKIDERFYVLVRNPNPEANYVKEGFDFLKWGFEKVEEKLKP